jgi:DHA2 family multidrug resistance protein
MISNLWTNTMTLDISPTTLFWPITVSGFAISLVFIPLSRLALRTLPQSEVGNASGIFNFLRNVGGSVGISMVNTIAQRHLQTHRDQLVHSFSGGNPLLVRQLRQIVMMMRLHAGPAKAVLRAYRLTSESLNQHAQLYSYVDDFRYLAIACVVCIPIAMWMKATQGKSSAGG